MHIRQLALVLMAIVTSTPTIAEAAKDVSGKVVLANLDRYDAQLRVAGTRREIKPQKAAILTPAKYPITIEYWTGNTRRGWKKKKITRAGIYGFNFKRGHWELSELKKGVTPRPTRRPSSRVVRRRIISHPVRRLPINVDRNRWSPLARAAYAASTIYQFVRDEQDRDLLRHLLIRAREDEDWDQLERWLRDATIPELYKNNLRRAFEELGRLSDAHWDHIDTADEQDWEQARADLGALVSDSEWDNLVADYAEIDTEDYWLDDRDIDLGDIDFANNVELADMSIALDDRLNLAEDVELGDLGIDASHYDLGVYDDFGSFDGAGGVDMNDFWGGYMGDDDFGDYGGFDDFDF